MKDAALLIGVFIILGGVGWYLFNSAETVQAPHATGVQDGTFVNVDTFTDCVAAGNAVMESYPRQCRHEGILFVEEITEPIEPVACTMDAKLCPDGSSVGRVGPDCEFAQCPNEESDTDEMTVCSPESKLAEACTMEYAPVCGLVEIQCITTPCNPIPETFSNSCVACSQGNVLSYTTGMCN